MSVLVAKEAPDFKAQAVMPNGGFKEVSMSDFRGKYVLLFFYPLDFTFVCPTEIIAFSEAAAQFEKLGVQILGCSIDSHFSHLAWRNTPRKQGGIGEIAYPLIADLDKKISQAYDVLLPGGIALRGLFGVWMRPCEWSRPFSSSRPTAKSALPTGRKGKHR